MSMQLDYPRLAEAVVKELMSGQKFAQGQKSVSGVPNYQPGHGPGGTFSPYGLDGQIFNAEQLPIAGLEAELPVMMTNYTTPLYGIVTGQTATSGNEPTQPCADWPQAGLTKLCTSFAPLGHRGRSSREINLSSLGQFNSRADFRDFQFVGDPFKASDPDAAPSSLDRLTNGSNFLNNELYKQMRELRVALVRDFAQEFYAGNPSNNVGTGGREYFRGLDLLINTGYKDVVTNQLCPASDSIVESFSNQNIFTAGGNLVRLIDSIFYRLRAVEEETGTGPVFHKLVMRRSMFHELTEIWPCSYLTFRCNVAGGSTNFVDAQAAINMRDEMRKGKFLWVAGEQVPVTIDDAIAQTELTPGTFSGSIYVVPLKVMGNIPVLYREFFDFNGPGAAGDFLQNTPMFGAQILDSGKYLMYLDRSGACFKLQMEARLRLLLRTPYLAARITNVAYTPIKSERSPFPSDPYYVNGGNTSFPAPSYYSPT
jgi:hypothetical protein